MFHMPTVDEWWKLTAKYPQFRTPSNLTLKEYGYMRLFELIEEHRPQRILEFGHGFSDVLFEYCTANGIEVWGVDNHMDLPYFPPREEWITIYTARLVSRFPSARFHLGQIGTDPATAAALPRGYFDLICSVSVLEEIGSEDVIVSIASHARELLRPGGVFANTHDVNFNDIIRSNLYARCLGKGGFKVEPQGRERHIFEDMNLYMPLTKALVENPTQAMCCYNSGGADRIYSGHWTTIFSANEPA